MRLRRIGIILLFGAFAAGCATNRLLPPSKQTNLILARTSSAAYVIVTKRPGGQLNHTFKNSRDVWGLGPVQWIGEREETITLVTEGAWEYALKAAGSTSWFGSGLHGNENVTSLTFCVDGNPAALEVGQGTAGSVITIAMTSELLSPMDGHVLGTVMRDYRWNERGLEYGTEITWADTTNITQAYLAMCPAARGPGATTKAKYLTDSVVQDVSASGFAERHVDDSGAEYWNDANALRLRFQVLNPAEALNGYARSDAAGGYGTWVSNSASYNKFYATRVHGSEPVIPGTVWATRCRFEVW